MSVRESEIGRHLPSFIQPMTPDDFMTRTKILLQVRDGLVPTAAYGDGLAEGRAQGMQFMITAIANLALDTVLSDTNTNQSATAVKMLLASGVEGDAQRVNYLGDAERVATSYHAVLGQLARNPASPILSVFVGGDYANGVTIQAAHANGEVTWRTNPFDDTRGAPEMVIGTKA